MKTCGNFWLGFHVFPYFFWKFFLGFYKVFFLGVFGLFVFVVPVGFGAERRRTHANARDSFGVFGLALVFVKKKNVAKTKRPPWLIIT